MLIDENIDEGIRIKLSIRDHAKSKLMYTEAVDIDIDVLFPEFSS